MKPYNKHWKHTAHSGRVLDWYLSFHHVPRKCLDFLFLVFLSMFFNLVACDIIILNFGAAILWTWTEVTCIETVILPVIAWKVRLWLFLSLLGPVKCAWMYESLGKIRKMIEKYKIHGNNFENSIFTDFLNLLASVA